MPPRRTWARSDQNNRVFHRNLRDMRMNVIDPNDHYSLPSGYRFSRSDAESFLQERRFVNQPYDPFTNLPFPRAEVDGILQGMAQFLANPPPNPATRRQRPDIQLHPGNIVAPGAQRIRPNYTAPAPPPLPIPAYGMDNQTPPDQTPPYERMLDRAMQLGLTGIVQKLLLFQHRMPAGAQINGLITRQEVATAAGLTREDLSRLSEDTSGIALPERNNDSISPNGVPVRHHHGNQFSLRTAQRPVVIRTNAGTTRVTRI